VRVASDNVFGSDELSPELVRSASFTEQEGRYDAAEVRTFLDRIASSLEVYLSTDAASALRAEFARNASIAQQVLDAGQTAA
jgi:DivIVA domain-containing protein